MLPALTVVLSLTLSTGASSSSSRAPAVDMVVRPYDASLGSSNHLAHWAAPAAGAVLFLSANASIAGTGAGVVTLGVFIEGSGTVCSLTVPCTMAPGQPVQQQECSGADFDSGAMLHLEYSHQCDTPPSGALTAGFAYRR